MSSNQFHETEDQFFLLKGQLETGRITREQFDAAVKRLMFEDGQGRYWTIGVDGKWYVHNGQAWSEGTPPTIEGLKSASTAPLPLPPPVSYVPPTALPMPPPPSAYVPPPVAMPSAAGRGSSGSMLFIGIGVAAAVVVIALVGLFLAVGLGIIKFGSSPTPVALLPTLPVVPTISAPPTALVLVVTATPPPMTATPTVTPTVTGADILAQADTLVLNNKFDQAAGLYEQVAASKGANSALAFARWARVLIFQGYLEMKSDLTKQAVGKAELATQLAPNDAQALTWLARAYDWNGTYDKALTAAQKAVQLAPNSAEAYAILSEAEADNKMPAEAERDAKQAIQLDPNSAEAHRNLGYLLVNQQQLRQAAAEFESAAQIEPNFSVRQFEVGARYRTSNPDQAIKALQRAIELYPRNVRALGYLGVIYRDQKQYEQSIQAFSLALKVNDQNPTVHLSLSQTYHAAGNLPAAQASAQQALALDPNNQDIKTLIASLNVAQASPTATITVTPKATETPAAPPGLYVTGIRTEPADVKSAQFPTFHVTFLNSLGAPADANWYIKIFEPEGKQSFGETTKTPVQIPPGTVSLPSSANWKASGTTECRPFIARVFYIAADTSIQEFPTPGGGSFNYYFTVCDVQ